MTGVSLYLDEDAMRTDLVLALRSRSVNVLTAREAGMTSRDDRATHGVQPAAGHMATRAWAGRSFSTSPNSAWVRRQLTAAALDLTCAAVLAPAITLATAG